ncbi:2-oxoisovalerate dehydrogenase E2 component (dihydrolipoyl transacylase) [Rhizobium sp. SG_E_25_P2]|uniref:dihydrolipoamide acetyltransferase family protein n=1 Tax=Rhizobium sp. SG_E_25_P2 TaxID=2879942 RepID=UPI00247665D6|nr:dihydrolipoamide acetyltransferase family protein [Rhizobium sp. SG_E_25_P2]MDH6265151.1 2-oxoisovalerate dehydrogenase E2 component (dihydrolipoyl transacylase) [Rhizobium sp. SG_E_25_P2]
MTELTIKLPDVGEGVAEAELVEWHVRIGDRVREDDILAAVMTDKATVEIPAPVTGTVVWLGGEIGELLAVGGPLARLAVDDQGSVQLAASPSNGTPELETDADPSRPPEASSEPMVAASQIGTAQERSPHALPARHMGSVDRQGRGETPLASPAVRLRAKNAGVELVYVQGSGPGGRVTHEDLDAHLAGARQISRPGTTDTVREVKVVGLRRKIAERMAEAKRRIPHITIVEEIDVTVLEELRESLNVERRDGQSKLTLLPFLMAAIVRAVREQPGMNAHFDDDAEVIRQYSAVHIGIATQTKAGLMVPVVRHCERRTLWQTAEELGHVAEAARNGDATREQLTGSTISISSLGPLGAIATTPIINRPEVAIVGVNRMDIRPKWNSSAFIPRKMMNLSSSFDHRVIDGWDAAVFVKRLKTLIETPTLIFMES